MEILPAIVKIDDEQFGKLVHLPSLYAGNLATVTGAKAYTAKVLEAVKAVDILTVDPIVMEALIAPVGELRAFLSEAKVEVEEGRKPHTQKMDAIKSLFTGIEKEFDGLDLEAQQEQIKWEKEKRRRKVVADAEAAKAIAKEQEAVKVKSDVTNAINRRFATALISVITGMSTTYYTKTTDDLTAYGEALKGWTPELEDEVYQAEIVPGYSRTVGQYLTGDEQLNLYTTTMLSLRAGLNDEWTSRITTERDRLIDLIPSRITEMKAGDTKVAEARIAAEAAALVADVSSTVVSKADVTDLEASTANLEAVLTHSAPATGSLAAGKGSKVKQKYVLTNHAAFVAILQSWVKSDMALLTIDELNKKLSFMVTAANDKLNKGTVLQATGLTVEEDLKVRRAS
jgi:hypothetical protein